MSKLAALVTLIIFFALIMLVMWKWKTGDSRLEEADKSYLDAEKATTLSRRQEGFNYALKLYLELEKEYRPSYGTGRLYYNLGNAYFQLNEYPLAILYYRRAKELMPREERVQSNLALSLEKLSLSQPASQTFKKLFFFHFYLSLPERLQLFFLFGLSSLFFGSLLIWQKHRLFKVGLIASLAIFFITGLSLGYTRYLSPVEGIIIKSVNLRRDAGTQYAKVGNQPVPAGSSVEVLNVAAEGNWLKILSSDGELGYVPQESIRLIGP